MSNRIISYRPDSSEVLSQAGALLATVMPIHHDQFFEYIAQDILVDPSSLTSDAFLTVLKSGSAIELLDLLMGNHSIQSVLRAAEATYDIYGVEEQE